MPLIFIFITITLQKKTPFLKQISYIFFIIFVTFFLLYFWESNLYSRFLIFLLGICYQFCTFKNPIFSTHFNLGVWLLAWLPSPPFDSPFSPLGHLYLLPPPSLFSTKLCESLLGFQAVENTQGTDYWLDLSLSFWLPLFSFWSPLSPSSLFSSICNSMKLSGCSRLWRAHREVITG